ncbi:MAG: hypothetical protein GQ565_11270 [Candidatus Aegiribacteria sp.]|nr:hypothetical protein [Candidatus Aegiribacteria sp.]
MRIIIAGIVCLLASSLSAFDLIDTVQSLRQKAWESEYIPESTIPVVPLTDYDEFEVTELFRAVTIEELEASLTDGYPYSWLEETLRDESIPWEDRYWLDRRVRAAISQNLHVFYDTENNPVHVDADAIFPGEYYWREHMIVDPAGWNVPEGAERPVAAAWWDIGHLLNSFGRRVGNMALPVPTMVMSRDGEVSVISTGGNSPENPGEQPYACFMFSDGAFLEVPLDEIGMYSATVSQDGSIAAFSCVHRGTPSSIEGENSMVPVYIFDRDGNLERTIIPPVQLEWCWRPTISSDGNYLCHMAYRASACLIDCINGTYKVLNKPDDVYDQVTGSYSFSPDDSFLDLGGLTTGRSIDMNNHSQLFYRETEPCDSDEMPRTVVHSSNQHTCTALTTRRGNRPDFYWEMIIYIDDQNIYSNRITADVSYFPIQTEVSPNGMYLFINPIEACHGYPSTFGYEAVFNLPMIIMQIESR